MIQLCSYGIVIAPIHTLNIWTVRSAQREMYFAEWLCTDPHPPRRMDSQTKDSLMSGLGSRQVCHNDYIVGDMNFYVDDQSDRVARSCII